MIAFDTNVLVRMLVEDDRDQARMAQEVITFAENHDIGILIIPEVLIETVWVLESVYQCTKDDIGRFLETLIVTPVFTLSNPRAMCCAVQDYRKNGGDFADILIVNQAREHRAKVLFSFDKKLGKRYPEFVVAELNRITLGYFG